MLEVQLITNLGGESEFRECFVAIESLSMAVKLTATVNWVKALSMKSSSNTVLNSIGGQYASTSMLKHTEFLKHFRAHPLSQSQVVQQDKA